MSPRVSKILLPRLSLKLLVSFFALFHILFRFFLEKYFFSIRLLSPEITDEGLEMFVHLVFHCSLLLEELRLQKLSMLYKKRL